MNHIIKLVGEMLTYCATARMADQTVCDRKGSIARRLPIVNCTALVFACSLLITGCQTQDFNGSAFPAPDFKEPTFAGSNPPLGVQPLESRETTKKLSNAPEAIILREGDVVEVTFPGAANLNTTQQIRRDGKIDLPLVGELKAAGMMLADLQAEILKLYEPQLVTKEVNVTLKSSFFPVFVTGAVLRPGKITTDRPITALEAIMEAGGFDYTKANLKAVQVIRNQAGQVKNYKLNLKLPLQGKPSEPFYLKPSDIVFVPERFNLF